MFVGLHLTFGPMHIVGLMGMPRRVYTYEAGQGWDVYNLLSTIGAFVMFAGIGVFLVNLVYSHFRGEPAGHNPWGADSLEWSVSSPPPDQGYSVPPIVHSRHPLWDQDDLTSGDRRTVGLLQALARWPLTWRAALVTSTNHAEPEEVIRVSGPSIWPFVAACGTVLLFIGEMIHRLALIGFSVAVLVVAVVMWNRPEPVPTTDEEEEAFEADHDIAVRTDGGRTLASWGMGLAILVGVIAFSTILLAYFYLRVENPEWPPEGVSDPALTGAVISCALIVASALAMTAARRSIRSASADRLRAGLIAAGLLTIGAGAVLVVELVRLEFDAQTHAYGSIVYLVGGTVVALGFVGLVINGVVLAAAMRGRFTPRRHAAVTNAWRYWTAMTAMWLIGVGTITLTPALT